MTTRRRRQGSESEHRPLTETAGSNILKGPSSNLLWSSESLHQPSVFFVPPSQAGSIPPQFNLAISETNTVDAEQNKSGSDMMASVSNPLLYSANSTSRDRTAEFLSAVRSLQNRSTNGMLHTPRQTQVSRNSEQYQQYSEFMRVVKIIGKDLSNTFSKLDKLTLLAKKRSLFDDRPEEINELTYIIREDIKNLNKQIGQLQGFTKKQQDQQRNTKAHATNVVVALQSKLATMSSEFKQILEVRTENLKAQNSRREQFSGSTRVVSDLPVGALTGGPFGSQNGTAGSVLLRDEYHAHGGGGGGGGGDSVAIDMAGADNRGRLQVQQTIFSDDTELYLQSRADAVQGIESTIVELGGIFQQLALMVHEQEQMVQR